MKAVGYCATRNLYPRLATAINSLLTNNPNIDKVYCVLEDSELQTLKDERIEIVNINLIRTPFWKHSPNYDTTFTYMSLTRLLFAKMFPTLDRILYLDVDTIVNANIEGLFEIDMVGQAVAGVKDKGIQEQDYINAGVMLMNLDYIRAFELDDQMITLLNSKHRYLYPDQDVMNLVCKGKKHILPEEYNIFSVMEFKNEPKIVHFAGFKNWWDSSVPHSEYYKRYKCESI